ncbi:pilin [Candidatus Parcubacteria bacterium]|nr:pilin [Candidatus Parcubacteria bacterium]
MKFKLGILVVSGLLFAAPFVVGAQSNTFPTGNGLPNTMPTADGSGSSYNNIGGFGSFQLTNPLKVNSVCGLIKALLQALLIIGLPIAVIFIIFAGLKYVAALGNPGKIAEANSNLLWTVIGIAIFLGAALIAQVIATTVNNISSQSGAGFQNVSSCN